MATLIDSSILISAEKGRLDLEGALADVAEEPVAIAAITASELLHGVHRARPASRRTRREAWVEALLARLPILPFDLAVARYHAALWAVLAEQGAPIGAHDLLIAATALAHGYAVATRDDRSFSRVPGLTVRRW
jgi:predicted nucleic acid-binding protein